MENKQKWYACLLQDKALVITLSFMALSLVMAAGIILLAGLIELIY